MNVAEKSSTTNQSRLSRLQTLSPWSEDFSALTLAKFLMVMLGLSVYSYLVVRWLYAGQFHLNDFNSFYLGSILYWERLDIYDTYGTFKLMADQLGLSFSLGTGYSYPPLLAFLFYPYVDMTFEAASRNWVVLSLAGYVGFCLMMLWQIRHKSLGLIAVATLYLVTFQPAYQTLVNGQSNILLLWAIWLYLHYRDKLPPLSVLGVSLAAWLKVYPAIFWLRDLVALRFQEMRLALGINLLIVLLLVLPVASLSQLQTYVFDFLPAINGTPDTYYSNQSMNGFFSRLLLGPDRLGAEGPGYFRALLYAVTAFALAGLGYLSHRFGRTKAALVGLIYLGVMTLLAGKNSFWNFAPTVLIGLYLLYRCALLRRFQQILFVVSLLITNLLWRFVWSLNFEVGYRADLFGQITYAVLGSLGFFALLMQVIVLVGLLHVEEVEQDHSA